MERLTTFLKTLFFAATLFSLGGVYSQVGIGTVSPNPNAALEVFSETQGLLLPRVGLVKTNSPSPLSAHIKGMVVYNTATAGTGSTAVSSGYYVNDGSRWVRMADASKGDLTDDAWVNDTINSRVHLLTLGDGKTVRTANRDVFIDDSGNISLGDVPNPGNRGLYIKGKDMSGTVIDPPRFLINASVTPTSSNEFSLFKGSGASTYAASKIYGLNLDLSGGAGSNHYGVYVMGENKNYFSGNIGIGTMNAAQPLSIFRQGVSGINSNFISLENGDGTFYIGRKSDRVTFNWGVSSGYIDLESSVNLLPNKLLIMGAGAGITSNNKIKGIFIDEINAAGPRIAKVNIGSVQRSNILSSFLVSNDTRNIGTQSGKTLIGSAFYQKITADAENLNLVALDISPTFDDNGQSGANHYGLLVRDGDVGIGIAKPKVKLDVDGVIRTKGFKVEDLPVGVLGALAYVTDALSPAYLTPVVGGGSIKCPVFYNGTAWVCH